jgi:sirohydrochlorin cobaltochelatase
MNPPVHGLILFAHGAREPAWAQPFEDVARRAAELAPHAHVRLAFLELMQPDLRAAATDLAIQGCTQVAVVPVFLGTGSHLRRDLPALVDAIRAEHTAVQWQLGPAIGEHPAVIEAIALAASGFVGTGGNSD